MSTNELAGVIVPTTTPFDTHEHTVLKGSTDDPRGTTEGGLIV